MTETAIAFFAKSDLALRAARTLLDAGESEGCINRAYYAAYHAASAMLAEVGETLKTHKGTHNRFWVRFVETGYTPWKWQMCSAMDGGFERRRITTCSVSSTSQLPPILSTT